MDPRLPERFWNKVRPTDSGCWEWTAARSNGYGAYSIDGKKVRAHRIAFLALVGPVADGLELDHLCRNRACVNPEHLEPVTRRENQLRGEGFAGDQSRREKCPSGHDYTPENTYVRNGHRSCRTCKREHNRKQYAARVSDPQKVARVRELSRERTRRYRERRASAA